MTQPFMFTARVPAPPQARSSAAPTVLEDGLVVLHKPEELRRMWWSGTDDAVAL